MKTTVDFRIARLDERNLILEEWCTGVNSRTGKVSSGYWKTVGYFGKVEDLAICLLNRQIEVPEGTLPGQIPALLAEVKAAEARIAERLKQLEAPMLA